VIGATKLERLLRRERLIVAAGLFALALLAWGYVLAGAGMAVDVSEATVLSLFPHKAVMAADPMAGMEMPGMDMAQGGDWGFRDWLLTIGMWAAMMVAMMTPSATPAILLYGRVRAHADGKTGGAGLAPSGLFAAGYLLLWLGFSALAAALHWALERSTLLSPTAMGSQSKWLSAAVLIAAGIYQLSPLKNACLTQCRSPAQFLSRHWRPGAAGAVRLGLLHGAYCVGCCWVLMSLLFVGGVMNLAWIAVLTLLVAGEKLLPLGSWTARAAGAVLVVWGAATILV
jgi:predicted metal-binding membrane protein